MRMYRCGRDLVEMPFAGTELPGFALPEGPPDRDWGWPGYDVVVPWDWPSGVYILSLEEVGGTEEPPPGAVVGARASSEMLFVVRTPKGTGDVAPIVYKVPWFTYQAYNATGYGSLYAEAVWRQRRDREGYCVTTRRPGGGTGGRVMAGDSPDAYFGSSPRQTFAHWDRRFISWLEARYEPGEVEYCTDWDVHFDPSMLEGHRLALSVGHDEYWSEQVRSALEHLVACGGNIAFFSGNISGWRVDLSDDGSLMWCAKRGLRDRPAGARGDRWHDIYPENAVTGVSFYEGGGWWDGRREAPGYRVQHPGHWAFSGVELGEGSVLSSSTGVPLIGYEADGCEVVERQGTLLPLAQGACACLAADQPVARNVGPGTFAVLGFAEVGEGWHRASLGSVVAMGTYTAPSGGMVFQAATTDWALCLGEGSAVAKVTENVLDRLRLPTIAIIGPLPTIGGELHAISRKVSELSADISRLSAEELAATTFHWHVTGVEAEHVGPAVKVEIPPAAGLVTVSVRAVRQGREVGFGSVTLPVLSEEEGLRLRVVALLRELVMPGDPSMPLVDPRGPLLGLARELNTCNLDWMRARSDALSATLEDLLALRLAAEGGRGPLAGPDVAQPGT
jgi:hypothetical protein